MQMFGWSNQKHLQQTNQVNLFWIYFACHLGAESVLMDYNDQSLIHHTYDMHLC